MNQLATDGTTEDQPARLMDLLRRSLEDDAVLGPDDTDEQERWDDDEGSSGG